MKLFAKILCNKQFITFAFSALSLFIFSQDKITYFQKSYSQVGVSAISINTINAKTFTFKYPVYQILADTMHQQLILSVRQKDITEKFYTNRGYHLAIKGNDSISATLQDTKLDIEIMGSFLLMSNDVKTSRFNLKLGYEQFEYPSKIIYPIKQNNTGLSYNPSFKKTGDLDLSCINLNDGKLIWRAPVPSKHDWNSVIRLSDSIYIIAAGGLHAININSGLLWSHPLITSQKATKTLSNSAFNPSTFVKTIKPLKTGADESFVTQLSSNILHINNKIYFAAKDKIISVSNEGVLLWQSDLSSRPTSNSLIYEKDDNIFLINLGIAEFNSTIVGFGTPYVLAFNKENGEVVNENKLSGMANLIDIINFKGVWTLANRDHIVQLNSSMKTQSLLELDMIKYGKFLEFVDGDENYIEKEGFYVPLNFINDNVIYFKTEHGKVFGINNGDIDYEYHSSELYKFRLNFNGKKLITQKNKSLLISENHELLFTFDIGEEVIYLNNKIYFAEENVLKIVNLADLK